jgi:pimeloyl-ACP methyl ester carboxylesterase
VVANSPASIPLWVQEANRLRRDLPPDVQRTLLEHEAAGTTDDPAYQQAMLVFYRRHVWEMCRRIPGARWELFEHSSHMPHVEERQRWLAVVGDFLDAVDG